MYTIGASHDLLAGSGSFSVSAPAGLLATVLSTGPSVGRQEGTPTILHRFGHLTPGDTNGYYPRVHIVNFQQIILPAPAGLTFVGYDLGVGCGLKVNELVGPAVANSSLAPWDRNPSIVRLGTTAQLTGGMATTTLWTYTVPTARKMMLLSAHLRLHRYAAAASVGGAGSYTTLDNVQILYIQSFNNVAASSEWEMLGGGEMVLPSGTVLAGIGFNADVGGDLRIDTHAMGYLFDA